MKYKKTNFWQKDILFYYYLLSENCLFYISQNTVFFNGTFCMHSFRKYLPIYFKFIILEDIEVWDFKIFKILKVKGSSGAHVHQIPSPFRFLRAFVLLKI
jgi:hypothetical protein